MVFQARLPEGPSTHGWRYIGPQILYPEVFFGASYHDMWVLGPSGSVSVAKGALQMYRTAGRCAGSWSKTPEFLDIHVGQGPFHVTCFGLFEVAFVVGSICTVDDVYEMVRKYIGF